MKSPALKLTKSILRQTVGPKVKNLAPKALTEPKEFSTDTVTVGLGNRNFTADTDLIQPAVRVVSGGLGVGAGAVAGTLTTMAATATYPAAATAVGVTTAAACMTADVEGDTWLQRMGKRATLAAALAPTAAIFAPAVLGAAAAVVTEEAVSKGAEWGINEFLIAENGPARA